MIAHNEEDTVVRALKSAAWADEIIFVDCGSTDGTAELAAGFSKTRILKRENSPAVHVNKRFAAEQASGDWVFILDADEEIPAELAEELRAAAEKAADAWEMPRRNFYFGRWLRHGGKFPDTQLRFFRKGRAAFTSSPVHERLKVDGAVARLSAPLNHYPYRSAADIPRKLAFYAEGLSENYIKSGKTPLSVAFRPFMRFFSAYILKLGFLDGAAGFKTAVMDFLVVFVSALRFAEKTGRPA